MRNLTVSCISILLSEHSLSAYSVSGTYAAMGPAVQDCICIEACRGQRREWLVLRGEERKMVSG